MMIANKAFPPPSMIRASSRLFSSTPSPQLNTNNFEVQSSRVSVWWDLSSCPVPEGVDPFRVSQSIVGAVRANGMYGSVKISGFADDFRLSAFTTQPLLVPTDFKKSERWFGREHDSTHNFLKGNLLFWLSTIHPPAHLLVISNDARLATTLRDLRRRNYNVLVATNQDPSSGDLCLDHASIVWRWDDLVKGDKLIGMYLNQPPDESLYGRYNVELENPCSVPEPATNSGGKNGAENFAVCGDKEKMMRMSKRVKGGGFFDKVRRMWFGPDRTL